MSTRSDRKKVSSSSQVQHNTNDGGKAKYYSIHFKNLAERPQQQTISPISISDLLSSFTSKQVIELKDIENWTTEQICSLLCSSQKNGGAGLSKKTEKLLIDADFGFHSIGNIIDDLVTTKENAVDEAVKSFPTISRDSLKSIVNWIESKIIHVDLDLRNIPSSFNDSIMKWNENIKETEKTQKVLLQGFYKTAILPTHLKQFNNTDYNLYSFAWDTYSIPQVKVKQLQEAIDESTTVGRGCSDKTLIAYAGLSGMGKTHSVFTLSQCKPARADRYLVVFTTKDSLTYDLLQFESIDSQICASIFAYSNLLLIQTLLEHPTTTNMNGLDFLRYIRGGGDEICCKIYSHICKINPVIHRRKCEELLKHLEDKYNVKIVFIFDEATQLLTMRANNSSLVTDSKIITGSMLQAIFKQFLFVNTVYIDNSLSVAYLMETIRGDREYLCSVFGTIKPWDIGEVSLMLLHMFNLPCNNSTYTGNFKSEFWFLCYLLIGIPKKSVTFLRMVLNHLTQFPEQELSETKLFEIFSKCADDLIEKRLNKARGRFNSIRANNNLEELVLLLLLDIPVMLSSYSVSLSSGESFSDATKLKLLLVERSIVPVEKINRDFLFHIIDPIDYLAYSNSAFNEPEKIWQKILTIPKEVQFEYMMILLLMHESQRLEGSSVRKSPLFSDLNGYEEYQLCVKGFIKEKSFSRSNVQETFPEIWCCSLHNPLSDSFVMTYSNGRQGGVFYLKPLQPNSKNHSIPVISAFLLVEEFEINTKLQDWEMFNGKTNTGGNVEIEHTFDKHLYWIVCPKMNLSCLNQLDNLNNNVDETISPLRANDDLVVIDNQSNRILQCIEQYATKPFYKDMKQLYSKLFE